jgi:hypothetical protein
VEAVSPSDQYAFALDLIKYEIQRLWTIFGFFLLAETVLLAATAQVFDCNASLVYAGSAIGLLLVLPWWATFENTRCFYLLRLQQAKKFEPAAGVFLSEGHVLANVGKVDGVRMGPFLRAMRPQRSAWFLMFLFALSFVGMGLLKMYG